MSIAPHISFKAGKCEFDPTSKTVKPLPEPGYLYLYTDEDLIHFCWRTRSASLSDPSNLDLLAVPTDCTFRPYLKSSQNGQNPSSPTTGRVCILKFSSSEARHFFWLQSREQPAGKENRNVFSERDLRLVKIVDSLLQGEEVDNAEVNEVRAMGQGGSGSGGSGADADTAMEDAQPDSGQGTGGAGPGATGGDVREEGEESREGGADGGRANQAAQQSGQTDLAALLRSIDATGAGSQHPQQQQISTTLSDLLPTSTTVPALSTLPITTVDRILRDHLPPEILTLSAATSRSTSSGTPAKSTEEAISALSEAEKRRILERVLRSPQLTQALGSITSAIRDGGLTSVSEALGVRLEGRGVVPGTGQVVNGGAAVEVFLDAVKKASEKDANEQQR